MPKDIEPIDADFDEVAKAMIKVATPLSSNNKEIDSKSGVALATPRQGVLDLGVEV